MAQANSNAWRELVEKEDWWAIWLGLGIILLAWLFFASGSSIGWIAVSPPSRWATLSELGAHFGSEWPRYLAQFLLWAAVFSVSMRFMGAKLGEFVPAFGFVYASALIIYTVGRWEYASEYSLEAPLVALVVGLLISNLIGLPRWLDAGFRVEYYIKTGIVLLGATLPFTLIIWAGPVALLQATIVSITTFLVIFLVGKKLGLDRRLCATLGAGGAVCGVSASIAIAGAVGAKKEHAPIAITMVVIWALIMIFFLPQASRLLGLHAGVAGAWIGTSEFADAAGLAAAQAYGNMAEQLASIEGTADNAVNNFTLMKVVGRDIWIGIWAFILAIVATTRWETDRVDRPRVGEIWQRFPKFVLGFAVASLLVTLVASSYTLEDYDAIVRPEFVNPIRTLRSWAFIFCFFSIGLTTRFRELAAAGSKPFWAFTSGVAVNVVIGFILSVVVFGSYWAAL
ncbi:MAG TPA: putative sulfate exporter family transporter [Gammaproteobacteria bacterium]